MAIFAQRLEKVKLPPAVAGRGAADAFLETQVYENSQPRCGDLKKTQ
jgi:hypothetical protein